MANPLETRDKVWARYEKAIEQVRTSRDLTAEAKVKRMAKIWHEANTAIKHAHEEHKGERDKRRKELSDRIFNPASQATFLSDSEKREIRADFRDALFRAESIEDEQRAEQLLRRAQTTGDTLLERAIGVIGFEKGWGDIAFEVAASLGKEETIKELIHLDNQSRDMGTKLAEGMAFTPPLKPDEIAGLSDYRLEQMATEQAEADAYVAAEAKFHQSVYIP